ncbi:acyl carrier protein [Streptomyces sp. NPDC048442]|uniref:acyl carrier protein n=1 Tax=Streptomyces sp. NPDC048442 TaxID=3154823 RepID=UPI003428B327
MTRFELTDLTTLLRECAGESEGVDLGGDVLDVAFVDLGYDSLAMLQTTGHIEREWKVLLDEDAIEEAVTPRQYLALVNETLAQRAAA